MPLPALVVAGGYIAATAAAGAMVKYVHNRELEVAIPYSLPVLRDLQLDVQVNREGIRFRVHRRGYSEDDNGA